MYFVFTSDGVLHEFATEDEAIDCVDSFGPEVVDHNLPDGGEPNPCSIIQDYVGERELA